MTESQIWPLRLRTAGSREPAYSYRAARTDGTIEKGTLWATTREDAASLLADRGLWPLEISGTGAARAIMRDGRRRMPVTDLALGLRVLAEFLDCGLPLARALSALEELAPSSWRDVLPTVQQAVREGKTFATALSEAEVQIPALVIGVIRAGESGGGIARAVAHAADIIDDIVATRNAIRTALAYPITLVVAGTASAALLVGVVLPRFAAILADLNQTLPASTQLLLEAATLGRAMFIPVLVGSLVAAAAWRAWTATEHGLRQWHALLLRIPVLGPLRRSAATARGFAALAALLKTGVPIAQALAHAARATGDAALVARLLDARQAVTRGERLSRALRDAEASTSTGIRLVRAGEESGRLPAMLSHASRLERERAIMYTRAMVRVLEPGLILTFGGAIALVATALLQALYSVRPAV